MGVGGVKEGEVGSGGRGGLYSWEMARGWVPFLMAEAGALGLGGAQGASRRMPPSSVNLAWMSSRFTPCTHPPLLTLAIGERGRGKGCERTGGEGRRTSGMGKTRLMWWWEWKEPSSFFRSAVPSTVIRPSFVEIFTSFGLNLEQGREGGWGRGGEERRRGTHLWTST